MTADQLKDKITRAFELYLGAQPSQASALVPSANVAGKVYEAYVFSLVARDLVRKEGCQLRLTVGTRLQLKSSSGPINQSYPHVVVSRNANTLGHMWTDVEFTSLSYWLGSKSSPPTPGDFHELDILITLPTPSPRPTPNEILLGVECKHTPYRKGLLREILGVRRELSLLCSPQATSFRHWPRRLAPADPASCLLVYSSSSKISKYASPGKTFGIDFIHEPV